MSVLTRVGTGSEMPGPTPNTNNEFHCREFSGPQPN